jgi:cohesin complex subunit SCC1
LLANVLQTFKNTTNHDLPHQTGHANDLNLPELLTIDDLFPSMDIGYPLSQAPNADPDTTLQDFGRDWTSTLNPQNSTQSHLTPDTQPLINDNDLDLRLDLGEDMGFGGNDTSISIQVGREGPAPRPIGEDLFSDDNLLLGEDELNLDLGEDVPMPDRPSLAPGHEHDNADDFFGHDDSMAIADDETLQLRDTVAHKHQARDAESPLSDAGSAVMRELDQTFADQEEIEEVATQQPQRSRKRKPVVVDAETTLHNKQIKAQAEDRSKILRPAAFLPRDPFLLTLMNMQKNGDFVSNIMKDGKSRNWAPELQGLLSFDVVRSSRDLKRKRDSGIADISDDEHSEKSPRLELPEDNGDGMLPDEGVDFGGETSFGPIQIEPSARLQPLSDDPIADDMAIGEDYEGVYARDDDFDDTTMPLIHPADNGPISLGTKHAVNMLRERFGGQDTESSPASQAKKSVLLQDLVPEGRTSREDATKMFFEVLVLATKDAIKVEQGDKSVGLPLRIRGKRGLWGAWAETSPADDATAEERARVGLTA